MTFIPLTPLELAGVAFLALLAGFIVGTVFATWLTWSAVRRIFPPRSSIAERTAPRPLPLGASPFAHHRRN